MQLINMTRMMKTAKNGVSVNPLDNGTVLCDSALRSLSIRFADGFKYQAETRCCSYDV